MLPNSQGATRKRQQVLTTDTRHAHHSKRQQGWPPQSKSQSWRHMQGDAITHILQRHTLLGRANSYQWIAWLTCVGFLAHDSCQSRPGEAFRSLSAWCHTDTWPSTQVSGWLKAGSSSLIHTLLSVFFGSPTWAFFNLYVNCAEPNSEELCWS